MSPTLAAPATAPSRLRRTLREAEGYLELGMARHAVQALQRRAKLVHASPRGCYLLGEALRESRRYREAVFPLLRSARLAPEDMHAWLALGWCYKRTGRLDQAIAALHAALRRQPDAAILHYNLACYWSLKGNRSNTLDHLALALRNDASYRGLIPGEPDFDPLRGDPGFQLLTQLVA